MWIAEGDLLIERHGGVADQIVGFAIEARGRVEGGIEAAIGIEPHHAIVVGGTRAARWLGIGVTSDQDLAVALHHHRIGIVSAISAKIQQGLAAGAKGGVEAAVGLEPHDAVVNGIALATHWLGIR